MYSIEFSQNASDQFDKLNKELQNRIISVLERIRIRPFHFAKRKQGTPYFIQRVGDHRLILDINNNKLIIYVIELGPRGRIYNN